MPITRGSEKTFQTRVIMNLEKKYKIKFQVIDGCRQSGIPDCAYSIKDRMGSGFIEFKIIKTNFSELTHFTDDQRRFMVEHGKYSNNCWLFLKKISSNEYFLFNWYHGCQITTKTTYEEAVARAMMHWQPNINYEQLFYFLRYGE